MSAKRQSTRSLANLTEVTKQTCIVCGLVRWTSASRICSKRCERQHARQQHLPLADACPTDPPTQ